MLGIDLAKKNINKALDIGTAKPYLSESHGSSPGLDNNNVIQITDFQSVGVWIIRAGEVLPLLYKATRSQRSAISFHGSANLIPHWVHPVSSSALALTLTLTLTQV